MVKTKITDKENVVNFTLGRVIALMLVSKKLLIYPSPNSTLTLSCYHVVH